jgi:MerR family transcriptional regulator/heat shock protein HspR
MVGRNTSGVVRLSETDLIIDDGPNEEPRYAVSVVAERCGVHRRTLLRYEEWGLIEPDRSGRGRLYSEADIDRVLRIRRLVGELGVNLAGAAAVLHLRQQVIDLQREMEALRARLER